jgi:hypothetical protein
MSATILVINPNSTESMTREIDAACEPLRIAGGPAIETATLKEGPPGIETQQHVDSVIVPLTKTVASLDSKYAAFVIACYSDPGLHSVREATRKPVLGIAECGILTALTLGHKFGVIAILEKSIPRHLRYMGALGVMDRRDLGREPRARPHGGSRQHPAREARRQRDRHGLRRHGALPQGAAARGRHPGGRADPGGGDHGDRAREVRLGMKGWEA